MANTIVLTEKVESGRVYVNQDIVRTGLGLWRLIGEPVCKNALSSQ